MDLDAYDRELGILFHMMPGETWREFDPAPLPVRAVTISTDKSYPDVEKSLNSTLKSHGRLHGCISSFGLLLTLFAWQAQSPLRSLLMILSLCRLLAGWLYSRCSGARS